MREENIGRARVDRITAIYALCEPDHQPRYVGKTVRYLHQRHKQHIYDAVKRRRLPVHRWLARRIAQRQRLVIKLLEYVPPGSDWIAREKHWIAKLREDGHDLLNLTEGGEGLAGFVHAPERNEAIARKLRTGGWFSCQTCETSFWRKRHEITKGQNKFCSRQCYSASLKGKSRPVSAACVSAGVAAAAAARKARINCKRGHPLSGENLFRTPSGSRGCKQCRKLHKAKYREKSRG